MRKPGAMLVFIQAGCTSEVDLCFVQASISGGTGAKGALFWEWTVRNQGETIDVSLPNGLHPYGVSLWDETFRQDPSSNKSAFHRNTKTRLRAPDISPSVPLCMAALLAGMHVQGPD